MVDWTEAQKELLKRLWMDADYTAADIAKELGQGATKNSVIGKAHRLKLPRKPKFPDHTVAVLSEARRRELREAGEYILSQGRSVTSPRQQTCMWPIGDPGTPEFHYCGKKVTDPKAGSWCDEHKQLVRPKAAQKQKEARRFVSPQEQRAKLAAQERRQRLASAHK